MGNRRLLGVLIVAVAVLPVLTLPLAFASPMAAVRLQTWWIPLAELVFACVALGIGRLESSRAARVLLFAAGVIYTLIAVISAMKVVRVAPSLTSSLGPWPARIAVLLFAAGLWLASDVRKWIPALFVSAVLLAVAAALIPQAVIDSAAQAQMTGGNLQVNWWALPATLGGIVTTVAWLTLGIGLIRRHEVRESTSAV